MWINIKHNDLCRAALPLTPNNRGWLHLPPQTYPIVGMDFAVNKTLKNFASITHLPASPFLFVTSFVFIKSTPLQNIIGH